MQHLRFPVGDLEGMLAELAGEGIEPVMYHSDPQFALAYVNSDRIGGVMFELLEWKEDGR